MPKNGGIVVVALLAEGVDRNRVRPLTTVGEVRVALLAEGVDRNPQIMEKQNTLKAGRPPRGGRG